MADPEFCFRGLEYLFGSHLFRPLNSHALHVRHTQFMQTHTLHVFILTHITEPDVDVSRCVRKGMSRFYHDYTCDKTWIIAQRSNDSDEKHLQNDQGLIVAPILSVASLVAFQLERANSRKAIFRLLKGIQQST